MEEKNIHEGHRKRLRARYERSGLQDFEAHEALEMILSFAIPRKDTNPLAHHLIDQFGSLSEVLKAPKEELMRVKGIGEYSATMLKLFFDTAEYCHQEKLKKCQQMVVLNTSDKAGDFFRSQLEGKETETLLLVCVDKSKRVCSCQEIGKGEKNIAVTNLQEISQICIRKDSRDIILAHNHPSGIVLPSQQDLIMTRQANEYLIGVGINLHDHFVVTDTKYYSMKEHNVF